MSTEIEQLVESGQMMKLMYLLSQCIISNHKEFERIESVYTKKYGHASFEMFRRHVVKMMRFVPEKPTDINPYAD